MIKQKNIINSLIYLFLFFNLFQLQKLNIEKINTWCYVFCGSQNQNFVLLIFITLSVATFIYFFIRYMKDSKLIWFFLIPLIYPIFTTKGNENRELGLAFMQSNNMKFFLPWNGNVFTEQYLYNLLKERNIALVSVGHRPTLKNFHDNVLELSGKGTWSLIPSKNFDFNPNIN